MARENQKTRTRKDLLTAAARIIQRGQASPTLDAIAAEAQVSRATAYRYFPSVEALLVEASLDVATPDPEKLFRDGLPNDPASRVARVETAFHEMTLANETAIRLMLIHSLQHRLKHPEIGATPARQNRRTPLIEAALAPLSRKLKPTTLKTLTRALALVIGTEAMIVCKDVLQLDDAETRKVKQWAVRALVEAAIESGSRDQRTNKTNDR